MVLVADPDIDSELRLHLEIIGDELIPPGAVDGYPASGQAAISGKSCEAGVGALAAELLEGGLARDAGAVLEVVVHGSPGCAVGRREAQFVCRAGRAVLPNPPSSWRRCLEVVLQRVPQGQAQGPEPFLLQCFHVECLLYRYLQRLQYLLIGYRTACASGRPAPGRGIPTSRLHVALSGGGGSDRFLRPGNAPADP
jgi:hypothetical protein